MRKSVPAGWLMICALAVLLLGCGSRAASPAGSPKATSPAGPPETSRLRVLYSSTAGSSGPLWIAAEKGLFQKYGLSADIQYGETSAGIASLVSGEAQIDLSDGPTAIQSIPGGARLKVVAVFGKTNPYSVVARPEITKPGDLAGKTIALLRPGDTTDISARIALKPYNVVIGRDVTPLQVGNSPSRLAALLGGKVAAALLSEGFVDQAVAQGMHVLISLEKEKLPYMSTAVAVTNDFAVANHNTILAFLQAMIEGSKMFADDQHRAETMEVLARYMKAAPDDPVVADAYRYWSKTTARDPTPDREGAQSVLDAMASIDPGRFGGLTPDSVLNPSFMMEIRASGFLDRVWR